MIAGTLFDDYSDMAVYQIINIATDNRYVGATRNFRIRRMAHFSALRKGNHANTRLQDEFSSMGESVFVCEVLEFISNKRMLLMREKFWINKLKAQYNLVVPCVTHTLREVLDIDKGIPEEPDVLCIPMETCPEIIQKINKRTSIPIDRVAEMMYYNVLTLRQFSCLSGLSMSEINIKIRPYYADYQMWKAELDTCHPFGGKNKRGMTFIIRNEKSEKYLQ